MRGNRMRTVTLFADWNPRPDFKLSTKDIDGKLTYLGSKVWRNPIVKVVEKDVPAGIGSTEVLIRVMACGICGSDVHMAQADANGYTLYPGLTAFPVTLGHEFAGEVVKVGKYAINKRTNKRFKEGEPVTSEEMLWCGSCKPCADGWPNHCERLQELGFSRDGAMAPYIKVDARYVWSLAPLRGLYKENKIFRAGSLVEPTSVAYNAVIERAGGIRPGENAVIFGGGPIGLAAVAILRRAGAAHVILSEPSKRRRELGRLMGATETINPLTTNVTGRVLGVTKGMGAKLYLEATGLFNVVWPDIERCIWEGRQLNSIVAMVARAEEKVPLTAEVFQVRRAGLVGSQGHSGHGTFSNVISLMASGMDMTPIITKEITFDEVAENLKMLQKDREEGKITICR